MQLFEYCELWVDPGLMYLLALTCLSGWWMSTGGSGLSLQMRLWKGSRRGRCSRARAPLTSPPLCFKTSWQRVSSLKPSEYSSFIWEGGVKKEWYHLSSLHTHRSLISKWVHHEGLRFYRDPFASQEPLFEDASAWHLMPSPISSLVAQN